MLVKVFFLEEDFVHSKLAFQRMFVGWFSGEYPPGN